MGIQTGRKGVPSLGGIPLKHLSLVTLTFQNSALILLMHYSRVMPLTGGQRYFTSTAVFLNEVIKLAISLTIALYELSSDLPPSAPATTLFVTLVNAIFAGDGWKLAIPAMLYTVQNTLQYVAVSNLDAATFQVTYQLKILSTALFSVMMLQRSLSTRKWISLLLLMAGVAIVQMPVQGESGSLSSVKQTASKMFLPRSLEELGDLGRMLGAHVMRRSATYEGIKEDVAQQQPQLNPSVGLAAVTAACMLSGLAGVFFEKVLKGSKTPVSLWIRNVQLSFYSLFPAFFIGVVFKDGAEIAQHGFFVGYNWVVWTAIVFQAVGGVIVALVVNYADNIAKNFATSISIVISFLASVWFFKVPISATFILGTCIVLYATYLYSIHDRFRSPPLRLATYEKIAIGGDSYFECDRGASRPAPSKYPFKPEAISTSRPGTPTVERNPYQGVIRSKGM